MSEMIPGYTHGNPSIPKSPISLQEFGLLQKTVLFGAEDVGYLRKSLDVLRDQVEGILDIWYGFVASQPHLLHYFTRKSDRQPDSRYLADVRKRFAQWIVDTAEADYDQKWLDYQFEIGRRHNREAKNKTDQVDAVDHIHLRFVLALFYPIVHTLRPFLASKRHSSEDVEKMHQAWIKAVLLQVILWSQPYVKDNQF
jgi:hypothetical protein